jgi:hypothetical protein
MDGEPVRTAGHRRRALTGALGGLHVAGFVASSALLERGVRWLPGFETSGLAEALARAGAASTPGAGGAGEGAALVFREALVPATWEELFFRGLLFAVLGRAGGPRAAILGSALLFGLAHGDLHHGLVAGLLGLSLGCLRARHGLAAAWLAHALNNALAFAGAPARALAADGSVLGVGIALALAGISNAILLQALGSGQSGVGRSQATASGDAGV